MRVFHRLTFLRFRFSTKQLFVLVAFVCTVAYIVKVVSVHEPHEVELNNATRNLRDIVNALYEYQRANKMLPYSERGEGASLFLLQPLIGAAAFDVRSPKDKKPHAQWDAKSQQLVNGNVSYLNEPQTKLDSWRVILACDFDDARKLYATGDGVIRGTKEPIPTPALVGSWVTREDFIVVGKSTFDNWCETHPLNGFAELTFVDEGRNPTDAILDDGSKVHYSYEDGRLKGCKITTASGRRITETIQTDQYGRIVGISRSPEK
jgi:hypothetical protein